MGLMAAVLVGGCGSEPNPAGALLKSAVEELGGGEEAGAQAGPAPGSAPSLTRVQIEAAGAPMIRIRLENENAVSLMTAQARNGPYTTYLSKFVQSLTLQGTLVTASRGMGYDLLSVDARASDPLVTPRPLAEWPARVQRVYRFPGNGPRGVPMLVTCVYRPGEALSIDIVEVTYAGRQVEEICESDTVSFVNDLFVEDETGFVRRSFQWLGPQQGRVDVEVLAREAPPAGTE
jgi:hypothetical protein